MQDKDKRIWTIGKAHSKGVYNPIVSFTSFLGLNIKAGTKVPSEAVPSGALQPYNKVVDPREITVQLALEGTDSEIQIAENRISDLYRGVEQFSVVTPDCVYDNIVLKNFSCQRDIKQGKGLLIVDMSMIEVGTDIEPITYTQVELPSYGCSKNTGEVKAEEKPKKKQGNLSRFACKCGCGYDDPDEKLVAVIEKLENQLGSTFTITSGCRCAKRNAQCGGAPKSFHVKGMAADVKLGNLTPTQIARAASGLAEFATGGGIKAYRTWTHLDVGTRRWRNGF